MNTQNRARFTQPEIVEIVEFDQQTIFDGQLLH